MGHPKWVASGLGQSSYRLACIFSHPKKKKKKVIITVINMIICFPFNANKITNNKLLKNKS